MRPNAVRGAMARLAASLIVLVGAAAAMPALAGDKALAEFLGYSADGRYFAFEEFGIQDGSGFPYSTIYIIDLPSDKWVSGSPYRVRIDEDGARLADARNKAHALAEGAFDELIINQPAHLIALNGDAEFAGDGKTLKFGAVGFAPGEVQGAKTLTLETFPAKSPEPCETYTDADIVGFALTLDDNGATRELFRDAALPKSRGCALDYRLYGVVAMPDSGGSEGAAVIVSVYPLGFEGPDRRFLAVPFN